MRRSRLTSTLAAPLALVVSLSCARAPETSGPTPSTALVTPGHALLAAPVLRSGVAAYRFLAPAGTDSTRGPLPMGRTLVTEEARTHEGVPALLRVLRVPERGLVDSLLVRRSDLAPIWERQHAPGRLIRVDFDGRRVRWARERAGRAPELGDTTYRVPVFAFNQLDMLVRAVASPTGVAVVLPMVSEGTSEMELDTLTLLSRDATRRRLRFADSAVVAHYDLDEPAREIAAHEIVMRYGGARYRRVGLE